MHLVTRRNLERLATSYQRKVGSGIRKVKGTTGKAYRVVRKPVSTIFKPFLETAKKIKGPIDVSPDYLADKVLEAGRTIWQETNDLKLGLLNNRFVPSEQIGSLIGLLIDYSIKEPRAAAVRLAINDSIKNESGLKEFYDPQMHTRPENRVENWQRLEADLRMLRLYSDMLAFNAAERRFGAHHDFGDSEFDGLINRVNEQLGHARDLTVITDRDWIGSAFADRQDFIGKKLARAAIKDSKLRKGIKAGIEKGNFVVVGPYSVNFGGVHVDPGLKTYFSDFINPSLEHLLLKEEKTLEDNKEAANSTKIGVDTLRGNLRGVKNVVAYVASSYLIANAAIAALEQAGVKVDPFVQTALKRTALLLAFYIPSYNEVAEIVGGTDVELLIRTHFAYQVGRKRENLSLYRQLAAQVTPEQTYQRKGVIGWFVASMHSLYQTVTGGLFSDENVFGRTTTAQVSANNIVGNIFMCLDNHLKPLVRERRRNAVAKNPELINYFGIDAIVEPNAQDPISDLNKLNPRVLNYARLNGKGTLEERAAEAHVVRRDVSLEVDRLAAEYMHKFEKLSKIQKQRVLVGLLMRSELHKGGELLYNGVKSLCNLAKSFFRKNEKNTITTPKAVRKLGFGYYLGLVADTGWAIGNPIAPPGRSEWRVPQGSYFNRSFPYYNVAVPAAWFAIFTALGQSEYSPAKIIGNTNVITLRDAAYVAYGIAALGAVTALGAADTAIAALLGAVEVFYEMARKGKSYLTGSHSKTVYNAINGKSNATFYEIPIDKDRSSHEQVENALRPLGSDFKLTKRNHLEERESSFVFQYTYAPKGLRGRLMTHITAVQEPDSQSFKLYSPFHLGVALAKYRKEPTSR